ncbi:MAG: hypothetical protein V1824_00955 [archaeon]
MLHNKEMFNSSKEKKEIFIVIGIIVIILISIILVSALTFKKLEVFDGNLSSTSFEYKNWDNYFIDDFSLQSFIESTDCIVNLRSGVIETNNGKSCYIISKNINKDRAKNVYSTLIYINSIAYEGRINYLVSNDSGSNWIEAKEGFAKFDSSQGNTLQYKLELIPNDVNSRIGIDRVVLDYYYSQETSKAIFSLPADSKIRYASFYVYPLELVKNSNLELEQDYSENLPSISGESLFNLNINAKEVLEFKISNNDFRIDDQAKFVQLKLNSTSLDNFEYSILPEKFYLDKAQSKTVYIYLKSDKNGSYNFSLDLISNNDISSKITKDFTVNVIDSNYVSSLPISGQRVCISLAGEYTKKISIGDYEIYNFRVYNSNLDTSVCKPSYYSIRLSLEDKTKNLENDFEYYLSDDRLFLDSGQSKAFYVILKPKVRGDYKIKINAKRDKLTNDNSNVNYDLLVSESYIKLEVIDKSNLLENIILKDLNKSISFDKYGTKIDIKDIVNAKLKQCKLNKINDCKIAIDLLAEKSGAIVVKDLLVKYK